MSISATPIKRKAVKVTIKVSNTGQLISSSPVTVQSLPTPPSKRLDALMDVDATAEVDGGVPVYYAANDTYVVEALNLSSDIEEIDGGSF